MYSYIVIFGTIFLAVASYQFDNQTKLEGRIFNGRPINSITDYPFACGLLILKSNNPEQKGRCGCTIISKSFMLTAASCVFYKDGIERKYYVSVGDRFFWGQDSLRLPVEDIIIHPNFQHDLRNKHDIAVIRVKYLPLSSKIRPIRLATSNTDCSPQRSVQHYMLGYGHFDSDKTPSDILRSVYVHLNYAGDCHSVIPYFEDEWHMCSTKTEEGAACIGDIGGPLVYDGSKPNVLCGVISAPNLETNCKKQGTLFQRARYYHRWICDNTWNEPDTC